MLTRTLLIVSLFALLATPAAAQQDFDEFSVDDREAGMHFLVKTANDEYVSISVEDLLAGLVDFPDTETRYVASKTGSARPTFTNTEMEAGNSAAGTGACISVPAVTGNIGWIAVAVPADIGLVDNYLAFGYPLPISNSVNAFTEQAGNPVQIGGEDYDIWSTVNAFSLTLVETMCFEQGATAP